MHKLTIYTATYNRDYTLKRVYNSLVNQTSHDFVWMVVDDGSTDGTKQLVDQWREENLIDIDYHYKRNGGVHTARDYAFHHCSTQLIASCDSDDWIAPDAVESWLDIWDVKGGQNFAGIISVTVDEHGKRITDPFPNVEYATYQQYTYKYKCMREKDTVLSKEIVTSLKDFPVFDGEKLVGEGYKWIQLPEDKPFILMDKTTRFYKQQNDGYMKHVAESRFKNPNGFREMYRMFITEGKYLKARMRGYIGYVAFSIILQDRSFIINSPKKLGTILLTPVGYLYFLKIKCENRIT